MSIDQIVKLIFDSGGTLGLAIFAIYMLNLTWVGRLADAKEHAAQSVSEAKEDAAKYKELAEKVLLALKENTVVSVQLLERMRPDASRRASDLPFPS